MSQRGIIEKEHSTLLAWAELLELTGSAEARVLELLELGWLQPSTGLSPDEQDPHVLTFRQIDVYRIRKLDRLCEDFELPSMAGAIIVDLLERIEQLEIRLKEWERI